MKFNFLYKLVISALCLAYLATVPMLAHAQETDTDDRWQFKAAIYLWAAGIESTTRRGNEIDVSFSDIVSDLNMAFMGTFVARKSKWSLAADVIYLDIESDKTGTIGSTSIPVNADAEVTGWVLNFHGARTVFQGRTSEGRHSCGRTLSRSGLNIEVEVRRLGADAHRIGIGQRVGRCHWC